MTALPPIDELYRLHRRRALAIVRRIVKDADDAEDVVQEVFARLSLQRAQFDGKAACSTWLHRILVNSSINALRAQKRRGRLESSPTESEDPLDHVLHDERHQQFMRALKTLSEQHQQLLTLRELKGLSYPEIARVLHLPEGTVKSALNRGRARLVAAMASQGVKVVPGERQSLFKAAPTPGRPLRHAG